MKTSSSVYIEWWLESNPEEVMHGSFLKSGKNVIDKLPMYFRYRKKKKLLAPLFYHARLWVQTSNGHSLQHYNLICFSTYFAHRR